MRSILERETFSKRLKEAFANAGWAETRPADLAREFNRRYPGNPVTSYAARKWLMGEAIPTQPRIQVLSQWFGVSSEWLRYGIGQETAPLVAEEPKPSYDYQLMRDIAELSSGHQHAVRVMVKALQQVECVKAAAN